MSRETHGAPLVRCLTFWLFTTAATFVVLLGLGPELHAARALADPGERAGVPFDALLTIAAAMVLGACTLWLWAVTTLVVVQAMTGRLRSLRGCPDGVRRLVLAACGLALVATAAPAAAESTAGRPPAPDDSHAVSGLPLPDRVALGPPASRPPDIEPAGIKPADIEQRDIHVVSSGDTLWGIAEGSLADSASDVDIDRRWRDIWAANRAAIGPDPDLIRPGTPLHLPLEKES
jgi:nucleoid-associated protein YgaU